MERSLNVISTTDFLPTVNEPDISRLPWELPSTTKVLVTGVGCLGAGTIIPALQEHGYTIIGTDANPMCYGRFHCDSFYVSPRGDHPNFANFALSLVEKEKIDVVLPLITAEQMAWSKLSWVLDSLNVPVLATNCHAIEVGLDKAKVYRLAEELGIPVVPWFVTQKAVSKPTHGKGGRGVNFLSYDEPTILMEHINGDETAVDALCKNGEILTCFARRRWDRINNLLRNYEVVYIPILVEYASAIAEALDYDWFLDVQFIGGYLSEINPRISTQFIWGEYNQPHLGIQLALGNLTPDQVQDVELLPLGLRSFYHYAMITYQEEQWPVGEL